jgi:hypothetical protein
MTQNVITLLIGQKPVTMQLRIWADGTSALLCIDDDQQPKREGKASRVFSPSGMAAAVGPVRWFTPLER